MATQNLLIIILVLSVINFLVNLIVWRAERKLQKEERDALNSVPTPK